MPGPLEGIRVVDLCHAVVGPWAAMLMGSMGADVIKVEPPGTGDIIRGVAPFQRGLSVTYSHSNLNKRGIVLDLKSDTDRDACYRLVEQADVLIENMRPGTAERLGMAYDKVSEVNPALVYVSASAWGRTGPMAGMGGVDPSVQAFSGWASGNGADGGKAELYRYGAHLDISTSSYIVGAALQGLLIRERTQKGLRVDVTMVGCAMNLQLSRMAGYFATGSAPDPSGNACTISAPHQAFLCKDKKWLAVGAVNEDQWAGLCRALGLEYLGDDPRFATNQHRVRHREELGDILQGVFSTKPTTWWSIRLAREGVPQGPFLDFTALRYHQQVSDNCSMEVIEIPHQGAMLVAGLPWRFDKTPAKLTPGPFPGQHTGEVIREVHDSDTTYRTGGA